ncbi:uncharacterized protein FMAN_09939 [Fusarium mangiferae]|uniref:Uncharacterized protein n=1 Tax=Fusarium mangiferae TaxID=192010 RepID=A0A1L7TWL7_FUSMA|nr:uncharacterized protein FMAN_09939 [Fusarium mangiferae]CVL00523.1 uncharacterized protein FMAN_09939 [Fusarium mangiferae]
MSASQSTVAAPAEGDSLDAFVARLMAETGATHVNFKITPNMPVNVNPGAPGAATSAGAAIDKLIADIKEKTGATSVRFKLTPNNHANINDGMVAASKSKL